MKPKSILYVLAMMSLLVSFFPTLPVKAAESDYGPRTPELLVKIYYTSDAEFGALEADDIDITDWPLDPAWGKKFAIDPNIELRTFYDLGHYELDINHQRWPTGVTEPRYKDPMTDTYKHWYGTNEWDDEAKMFRHAIAYLTPKAKIETDVLKGTGIRQHTDVPTPAAEGWTDIPELERKGLLKEYDPVKAAEILDAAGFVQSTTVENPDYDPETPGSAEYMRTDPRFGGILEPLKFWIRMDDPLRAQSGWLITAELRKAGIPVDPIETERTVCFKNVMVIYDYHLYTGGWGLSPDAPDSLYFLFHSSMYWGGTADSYYGGVGWSANYNGFAHNYTMHKKYADPSIPVGAETDYYDYWAYWAKYGGTFDAVYEAGLRAQEIAADLIPDVPLYAKLATMGFRKGWTGLINFEGVGPTNGFSLLNMSSTHDPVRNQIRFGFKSNLEGPNPVTSEWMWDWIIIGLIYDSLIGFNPYNLAEEFGAMAEYWETDIWEPGKMSVLFRLRADTPEYNSMAPRFHNGDLVRPLDIAFSWMFVKACGPGVAWVYTDVKDIVKVEVNATVPAELAYYGVEQNTALGPRDVKVYFDVQSYWAVHWVGFVTVLNERIWMAANEKYDWKFGTDAFDAMKVREYKPWLSDVDDDGIVDFTEDGSGIWIYKGASALPISTATWISFVANNPGRDTGLDYKDGTDFLAPGFYTSQEYITNYLRWAFHLKADCNDDGEVGGEDLTIIQYALLTEEGDPDYDERADVNTGTWDWPTGTGTYGDGIIDYKDYGRWVRNDGKTT